MRALDDVVLFWGVSLVVFSVVLVVALRVDTAHPEVPECLF
jgi:hypothetical protein